MAAEAKETSGELLRMRMSIDAIRQAFNLELDALAAQLDALLPPPDPAPRPRGKKYWKGYLDD